MAIIDIIKSISNVGKGTIIGVLFGSSAYLSYDIFNHLETDFKQNNFFSFCFVMFSLAAFGAVAEIYFMLNQEIADKVRYIRHADGTVEVIGDEEKINTLLNKND